MHADTRIYVDIYAGTRAHTEIYRSTYACTHACTDQVHPRGGPSEDLHTVVITDKMGSWQAQVKIATL